jgi:predicted RNase H-like HicB family nuclease
LALAKLAENIVGRERRRVDKLEQDIAQIQGHCEKLRDGQSITVPVETLAPDPVELRRPFQIVLQPHEGGYLATFFDAGISTEGDTQEEAVRNLKELVVDLWESFEEDAERLGPVPAKQLTVLRTIIKRPD